MQAPRIKFVEAHSTIYSKVVQMHDKVRSLQRSRLLYTMNLLSAVAPVEWKIMEMVAFFYKIVIIVFDGT